MLQVVKTKKTELLFLTLFLRSLKPGGRAAIIVPDGVLFGSSTAHKTLRKMLVENQKLDGIISLPGGVFKPYAGDSTAIVLFTKTNSGGTEHVWFYDMQADGKSLDDKRTELLPPEKQGPAPSVKLTKDEHAKNNLPDIVIINQLVDHGIVDVSLLYESPFTDVSPQGPDALFSVEQIEKIMQLLDEIRSTATAA